MATGVISKKKLIVHSALAIHRAFRFSMFSSTSYYYFLDILHNNIKKTNVYQGYIASLFSATGFVSMLTIGYILHQQHCYKKSLVVFSAVSAIAAAIYLIPTPATPMIGKALIGSALGHVAVVNSDLSSYKKGNRSSKLLLFINRAGYASSILGLLLVMFVLPYVDFQFGGWRIWEGNVPIILVVLCNTICFLLCVFLLPEDTVPHKEEGFKEKEESTSLINWEYWKNIKLLVRNKNYMALSLHTLLLHNARVIHVVYLPVLTYQCYDFQPRGLTAIILAATLSLNVYLYFLNKILNYLSGLTVVIFNTVGLLLLETMQSFGKGTFVCDLGIVIYMYITILIAPCIRVLMVAEVGKTVSKDLIVTAQSFLEASILIGSTVGAGFAGRFANNIEPVLIGQLLLGCLTTGWLLTRRKSMMSIS